MFDNNTKEIGVISQDVISILNLSVNKNTFIYIGQSNINHMKQKHPIVYNKYNQYISDIVMSPDYVGINTKDNSIEYVKLFTIDNEYVKVAVRVALGGKYYVRSIYILNNNRVNNYVAKGYLKPLTRSM